MSELTRSDYLRIKWPAVAIAVSVMVGIGLFAGLRILQGKAATQLRLNRTAYEEARQKVDKISQEEASIRANIGQYQTIKDSGMVDPPDLLQMQEHFKMLRDQNNLYPIPVKIAAQISMPLAYGQLDGKKVDNPGRQVVLQVSNINFTLPLLHENDFANLLNGLLALPETLQVQSCSLTNKTRSERSFIQLGQHLGADCTVAWYTFRLEEAKKKPERR